MKRNTLLVCLVLLTRFSFAQNGHEKTFQKWALTPPMGWNSWDCFGPSVVESEVKANADYMAANLKQYGWEYIVVDIRWYIDNQTTGTYNAYKNSTFIYDAYGRYMPSPTRFPSAANGAGFKPLADYIHSKGLKFGIHIMRGVPRVAVDNKLPIKNGNGKTAADIYSTASQCTWLQDNYTVIRKEGAQDYYNSIFELYASWGVDFVKIDDLSRPYHQDEIDMIRKAIDKTGRPIVLSMSPGETPVEKFDHVKSHANMWRTVDDFWDNWSQLNYQFTVCNKWTPYIAPGTWPDADMLPLGHIAIRGERGADRQTNFTQNEQYTLMTLWSIFKSPLMFGGHLPDNNAFTTALITNNEVLDMHKYSVDNKQAYNRNDLIAWTAVDPDNGDRFVALFNNGGDGFVKTKDLLYRSGTISRLTDNYGVKIDISLPAHSNEIYLIVNDGGDGHTNDHADWINPTLYKANGDSLTLSSLNWSSAISGWNEVVKGRSVSGGSLNVKGTIFRDGIGTHSKSVISFKIPEGYVRFKSFAGLDKGGTDQTGGATVEFMIANQDPVLKKADLKNGSGTAIPVDLTQLGFKGTCLIRNMWAKKDTGEFAGTQFAPVIKLHGAGLYRIKALHRSTETSVTLSTTKSVNPTFLNISVQKIGAGKTPTGWVQIVCNRKVIGVLELNKSGKVQFPLRSLSGKKNTITAKYSGDTEYAPQISKSIIL